MHLKTKRNLLIFYVLLFITILLLHAEYFTLFADDLWFRDRSSGNILSFISSRYEIWTSRLIIEATMLQLLRFPKYIWAIMDSFMFIIIIDSIIKLVKGSSKNVTLVQYILLIILIALIPLSYYQSAGFIATTLNYIWPLAFGLYSLTKTKKIFENLKLTPLEIILAILGGLFASNSETMSLILFGFNLIFFIQYYLKNKTFSKYISLMMLITIASIIFHATCPGNAVRSIQETITWYPDYANFSIVEKLILGFGTLSASMFKNNLITFSLFLCIWFITIYKNKSKIDIIFCTGFLGFLYLILFQNVIARLPILNHINKALLVWTENGDTFDNKILSWFILMSIFAIYIFITFYVLIKYLKSSSFWPILVIIAGMCSKFVIALSPTVFASGSRTTMYLNYLFIIAILLITKNIFKDVTLNIKFREKL